MDYNCHVAERLVDGSLMDILQVRYFSKVYETMNYAHAADQLYVSRQALRKVIHNLEREMGHELFVNEANHLCATEAADRLYALSRGAVRGFKELEDGSAALRLHERGIVRIGRTYDSDAVFSRREMGAFMSYPADRHPVDPSKLRSMAGSKAEIERAVLRGQLDYGLVLGVTFDRSLFDCTVARSGRVHLAVNRSDPLCEQGHATIGALARRKVALPTMGNDIAELLIDQARLHGFELDVTRYDPNIHQRLADAQMGRAAAIAYRNVDFARIAPDVSCVPFKEQFMSWEYCVIAKRGMGDDLLMRYFAGMAIDWDAYLCEQDSLA